ncbi:MAG: class I SAM-dependent DNA methyltransferase [Opitutales bacterium]|nr:class I SAM-dependent DNA methyltransferase [Opitutales bacterium]
MPLSWNEIRQRAIKFSREWEGEARESAEYASFWNDFFEVFGIRRRTVASFQEPVRKLSGDYGFIDLFWKGTVLVEHKSLGKSFDKAECQAFDYIQALCNEGREEECPRYVILSDYKRIKLFDLEPDDDALPLIDKAHCAEHEFELKDFHKNVHLFAFIPGYKQYRHHDEAPVNLKAVKLLSDLHIELEKSGYGGHDLEVFLVRVLFCLFADDTGIFERDSFKLYIENKTREDGSDLGVHLARLFQLLNTPPDRRQTNLDEDLAAFPYVNGGLFAENLNFADLNRAMRERLLRCANFDWAAISPAAFGSLFQGIMDAKTRRELGAHYTSEADILKLIRPLFLDALRAEFESAKNDRSSRRKQRLENLLAKLPSLTFFDPACGCGNFLIIAYRELRLLEIDILKEIYAQEKERVALQFFSQVDVDQFYGIELEEWPARIAEVSLWLMDHKMNQQLSLIFGELYVRIPLKKSPNIHVGNALTSDWKNIIPPEKCSYILGNPPFAGRRYRTPEQIKEVASFFSYKDIDYVACWYKKAAQFIARTQIRVGFVSTNSITQGEQVNALWTELFSMGVKIHFAYNTFSWQSEASGKAHVRVVIIGFGLSDVPVKTIYETTDLTGPIISFPARNINGYLIDAPNVALPIRTTPICDVPKMLNGNVPLDGDALKIEREDFPKFKGCKFVKNLIGGRELLHNEERYVLWLVGANPAEIRKDARVMERVVLCRERRLAMKDAGTRKLADSPTVFRDTNNPQNYIALPMVSSERREYLPMAYLNGNTIPTNQVQIIPDATLYHFGILTSTMHNAWMRQVCGRLESRYRYSAGIVYNNFIWPTDVPAKAREKIEALAQKILDVRKIYIDGQGSSLADLYDPLTMPGDLLRAHRELDKAVDKLYRKDPFTSERERVEFLFSLYESAASPLAPAIPRKKKKQER